jgi:hypothetical protein
MTSPILTSTYNFDNASQRWRDSVTGRYVSNDAVNAEMFRHSDATHSTLESLTRQLYAGDIPLAKWQIAVASELNDAHLAQAMFAVGGRANMGQAEFGRVGQTLREQYGFLNRFAEDIAAGRVSEARALNRIQMYGEACKQSYWAEYAEKSDGLMDWVLGAVDENNCDDCPRNAANSPYKKENLPSYPADGTTKCKTRCRCTLVRRGER